MAARGYANIDVVVCNLYPFEKTVAKETVTIDDAVENIDIGASRDKDSLSFSLIIFFSLRIFFKSTSVADECFGQAWQGKPFKRRFFTPYFFFGQFSINVT
jgi:hypothetical protein